MNYSIGIDMGGTNIKGIAIMDDGKVLSQNSRPTRDDDDFANHNNIPIWAREIKALIADIEDELGQAPMHVGVATPGLVAPDGRSIAFMPGRLHGLEGFDWSNYLGMDVPLLEDAKAALLAEAWLGAAAGCRNAIMLTLGTGVGGAIFADGKLLMGQIGRAGNLGHMTLGVDDAPDITGMPGSLENAIGECTVSQRCYNTYGSTKDLVVAVESGNEAALQIWNRAVYKLACGIASLVNIIDPEIVLIGGGISKAGDTLFKPLNEYLAKVEWRPNGHRARIIPATLGEWAGSMGSAYNAILQAAKSPATAVKQL